MKQSISRVFYLAICLSLLVSCGGSEDTTAARQAFIDAANAKEAEARRLAVDTPCTQTTHCANLGFASPAGQCGDQIFAVYSTASTTAAAAVEAAAQQVTLSRQAQALYSGPAVFCVFGSKALPTLACVASRCVAID